MRGLTARPPPPSPHAPRGRASPLSMLRAQGSSSQSSLSWQLDWAFQVLAKPAPVASTSPPAVLKSSPSRPLKFPQRPEGQHTVGKGQGAGRWAPRGASERGPPRAALTLHAPLRGLVQRHEELHDGLELYLQPEPHSGADQEVAGGRPEDREAGCRTGASRPVSGGSGAAGPPSRPQPLTPPAAPGRDSPVTWGRFTRCSFSSTLPSDWKATTCRRDRGDGRAQRGWGPRGAGRGRGGTHVLPVVGQQNHRLQASLLVRGAAGGQLTQEGVGVVVVALPGTGAVAVTGREPDAGPRPTSARPPAARPATLIST